MRSERLFSLLLVLADGKIHSGATLARRFGVSARSLYRDMELLSSLGVPVESLPGRFGGFRVLPGYTLDRSVLDEGELAAVAAALGGIERATGAGEAEFATSKLRALLARTPERRRSWIRIELAHGGRDAERIELFHRAIEERRLVEIAYRDAEGATTRRRIEPRAVVYLWQSWYLWAYCRLRESWRLFKLSRIDRAMPLIAGFPERPEPSDTAWREEWESATPTPVLLGIEARAAPKAEEWFGPLEALSADMPGFSPKIDYQVRLTLPENEWLIGYLLSFGEGLRVLEPERLARSVACRAAHIAVSYAVSVNHDES